MDRKIAWSKAELNELEESSQVLAYWARQTDIQYVCYMFRQSHGPQGPTHCLFLQAFPAGAQVLLSPGITAMIIYVAHHFHSQLQDASKL